MAIASSFPLTAEHHISLGNTLMYGAPLAIVSFSPKEYLFLESNSINHVSMSICTCHLIKNTVIPLTVLVYSAAKCDR